jgi:hypothetical protein
MELRGPFDGFVEKAVRVSTTCLICKSLDLRFQSLLQEIATRHSSHGGEFGERIDPVKDAIGRSDERPSQATGYGTGSAGASKARVLDRIESASPIMPAVR